MKAAIYTCITNGYDQLKAPRVVHPGIDYYCFNDGTIYVPEPWQSVPIKTQYKGAVANRFYKLLPHRHLTIRDYDVTVYVDGSVELVGDLWPLISRVWLADNSLWLYDHPSRFCVYEELMAIAEAMKAPLREVQRASARLRKLGVGEKAGLFECTIVFRRNSAEAIQLMEKWWEEYLSEPRRDQVALSAVLAHSKFKIGSLGQPDHRLEQELFHCAPHTSLHDRLRSEWAWWVWRPILRLLVKLRLVTL